MAAPHRPQTRLEPRVRRLPGTGDARPPNPERLEIPLTAGAAAVAATHSTSRWGLKSPTASPDTPTDRG